MEAALVGQNKDAGAAGRREGTTFGTCSGDKTDSWLTVPGVMGEKSKKAAAVY